jgi:threonine dehydrogenase-like Zn-dependent dehydrogenase
MEKHLSIIVGQSHTQKHWKMCLNKVRSTDLDPTFVVSDHIKMNELSQYYEKLSDEKSGTLKCFIRISN